MNANNKEENPQTQFCKKTQPIILLTNKLNAANKYKQTTISQNLTFETLWVL